MYWEEKCRTTFSLVIVCNCRLDHCNGHKTCEKLIINESEEILVTSTCLSVAYPDLKTDQVLAYQISREIYTPYADETGMLIHMYVKLTMTKLTSSRLSYNWVVSLPPVFIFNRISKYIAEVSYFKFTGIWDIWNHHMNEKDHC
jgi:hypothetical protein